MKIHELKLASIYFNDVMAQNKNFEIRKNDRNFEIGDILSLSRYQNGSYRQRQDGQTYQEVDINQADTILRKITYISDYEQKDNIVVLGMRPLSERDL